MSQAGINGNGSIAAIFEITTDNGTATPTGGNINLYADTTVNSGTVSFSAVGSTIHLNFQDSNSNMGIGLDSIGVFLTAGVSNICLGDAAGRRITSSSGNIAVGPSSLNNVAGGFGGNIGIGSTALALLVTGDRNIAIGPSSASAYTTNESSNIIIGWNNNGTILDNNTLRIGRATGSGIGELNRAFIQGIVGVTTVSSQGVTINTATGQLGAFPLSGSMPVTYIDNGDSPYTVLDTDVCIVADSSLGTITVRLPNIPFQGRVFFIKDIAGSSAANNITVTTVGGVVNIDATPSFVMNTNYQSIQVVFSLDGIGSHYSII